MGHTIKISKGNSVGLIILPNADYVDSPSPISGDLALCALITFFCTGKSDGRGLIMTSETITPMGLEMVMKKQGFDVEILNPKYDAEVLP